MKEDENMYPEWVMKHKKKGTNISCINGRYYLYEVKEEEMDEFS